MPSFRAARATLVATAATLSIQGPLAPPLAAQSDTWALTNARIQTVTRGVIERGTIVIRNGLIQAVGATVPVPADARVLDLGGRTVSPGLIDLTTSLGLPASPATTGGGFGGGGGGGGGAQAQPGARVTGLEPDRMVATELRVGDDARPYREAGITAVLSAPARGSQRGLSALVPTRDSVGADEVIRSPVASHFGWQGVQGAYPGTLLGVIAHHRQSFYDAQRHGLLLERYRVSPRGMSRPPSDPGLEALVPVVRAQLPAFWEANNENEIRRAARLAKEFTLSLTVVGATEGWRALEALTGRPVVVSVNFPTPTQTTGWSYRQSQRRPPGDSASADRDARKLIEGNAAALHRAGIKFALASGGARPAEFVTNLRKAVAAGLPAPVALEAVTIRAAELAGAAEQVGSIEAGKIANLVVTEGGDVLADSARVRMVFVDGTRYEVAAPAARAGAGNARGAGQPPAEVGGRWALTVSSPQGPMDIAMTVAQSGTTFTGSMTSMMGTTSFADGQVRGRSLTWSMTMEVGGQSLTISYRGEVDGDRITGSAEMGTFGSATFTGSRRPS